jgi:peptidoglycan/xylan/chitin deacetylase (PgdA/CDA1 family)
MLIDWKNTLFRAGFAAITATRADRWLHRAAQGCGVILMLHRVRPWQQRSFAPNRFLEITPVLLDGVITLLKQQGFDLIALDDVPSRLEGNRTFRPFAVITFDDGYRDNLEYAWPILKRHGAPWTVFIVPEFLDRCGRLWWLELEETIARLDFVEVMLGETKLVFETRSPQDKNAAYCDLCRRLKAGPEHVLRAVTDELASLIGLDLSRYVGEQCASWDEISVLARDPSVTIGSHTLSHPSLLRQNSTIAAREIKDSKSVIENRLGVPVRHLAFPFGDSGPREFLLARDAGYLTAVTTRPGHVWLTQSRQLTTLPRVSINGNYQTEAAVRALLSGVPFMWHGARLSNGSQAAGVPWQPDRNDNLTRAT